MRWILLLFPDTVFVTNIHILFKSENVRQRKVLQSYQQTVGTHWTAFADLGTFYQIYHANQFFSLLLFFWLHAKTKLGGGPLLRLKTCTDKTGLAMVNLERKE